jgi:ABC-type Fe3+ transport system permease subunit
VEDRNVIIRDGGGSVGTASFVALLVIAAIIALCILQPWERTSTQRFMTITTTQQDRSDQH